jgi:hypothetical protein
MTAEFEAESEMPRSIDDRNSRLKESRVTSVASDPCYPVYTGMLPSRENSNPIPDNRDILAHFSRILDLCIPEVPTPCRLFSASDVLYIDGLSLNALLIVAGASPKP